MRLLWSIIFLLTGLLSLQAQRTYSLEIRAEDNTQLVSKLNYRTSFLSKPEMELEIRKVFRQLMDKGHLATEIISRSSSETDSLRTVLTIRTGPVYRWAKLKPGNIDEPLLEEVGFRERMYQNNPFSFTETRRLQEKILTWCEDHGYPFAQISLDSIQVRDTIISAALRLDKHFLVKIDSVVNRGGAAISEVYLQSYLSIRNGDLYNESLIRKVGARLKELPFLKERIPYRVLFAGETARLELFLEKKRASQFDGILGMLPDAKTGKILLTGDVRLKLFNSFNRGELLELNWRRLQAATQDLRTRFLLPFLFRSPFGADVNFKLYKKDSTYLEVNPNLGVQYHLSGGNYFKVFINQKELSLLSTSGLSQLTSLPPYADVNSLLYGAALHLENLDYRLNPRKGYSLNISGAAGNKTIRKNDKINDAVYQGIALKSAQYQGSLDGEIFFPLKLRSTLMIGARCAYLHNSTLFRNELFRIGGLQVLRGFDEESIAASQYFIGTFEYRYLFGENSYLFLFTDGGYYENRARTFTGDRFDWPFGFGSGISFETKAGIFSLSYALGKQFDNPISFRGGKVHFGIVNYF